MSLVISLLRSILTVTSAVTARGSGGANTWWGVNSGSNVKNTIDQWLYVGHTCKLRNGDSLTPMLGTLYSWKFNQDADGAAGFYYTHGGYNFYLWGNDFLKDNPRFVVGVDFKF